MTTKTSTDLLKDYGLYMGLKSVETIEEGQGILDIAELDPVHYINHISEQSELPPREVVEKFLNYFYFNYNSWVVDETLRQLWDEDWGKTTTFKFSSKQLN